MDQIKDLLVRLFLNFRTSLDGALLAVIAWLVANGITLSDANRAKILGVGALVAGAVWKLLSKDPIPQPSDPSGGGASRSFRMLCVPLLLLGTLPLTAAWCDKPEDAQRTIVAATYDAQLAIDASAHTSTAFNQRGRLSLDKHKAVARKMRGLSTAFNEFGTELEQWPQLDATNKPLAIDAATRLIGKVGAIAGDGDLLAIDADTQSQIRRGVVVAAALANAIKVAIASAPAGAKTRVILLDENEARTIRASQKGFSDQDVQLTEEVIGIWSDFLVKLKLQRGQSVDTLRGWRDKLFADLQAYLTAQLARS